MDHDEPAQQQRLHRHGRLQPSVAQRADDAQSADARHTRHRVQAAQQHAQARLVQQVRRRHETQQLVQHLWEQPPLIRERRQAVDRRLDEGRAGLGGELGSCRRWDVLLAVPDDRKQRTQS